MFLCVVLDPAGSRVSFTKLGGGGEGVIMEIENHLQNKIKTAQKSDAIRGLYWTKILYIYVYSVK